MNAYLLQRTGPSPVKSLLTQLHRLRHITGFVTVYGERTDPRTGVFARLWHIRRVVAVTRILAPHWRTHEIQRVKWLAWLHDLNRWPFAHNAERGRFSQSANTRQFFADVPSFGLDAQDYADLVGIQRKTLDELTTDAKLVLAADAITGAVEDILLLISGLNVRPEILPVGLAHLIGVSHRSERWRSRHTDMASILHGRLRVDERQVKQFLCMMHAVFTNQVAEYVGHLAGNSGYVDPRHVLESVHELKETVIRPVIFPVNNDLVCRGRWLREEVMPWYLEHYGDDDLVHITESQFVSRATKIGSAFRESDFLPDLDIVCREYQDLRLVPCWSTSPARFTVAR